MSSTLEALSNDLAGAVSRVASHVVAIHARRRIPASGIVWRPALIVAADHTIHKDDDIRISTEGGGEVRGRVIGRDAGTDLCLIRVDATATANGHAHTSTHADAHTASHHSAHAAAELAPAPVSHDAIRIGQLALTVGRPGADVTASLGVISAVGPEWRTWRGGTIDQFIRLDLAVYDGFSGAPLVNAAGQVVGLCTSGLSRGAAVAVPAKTIDRVVDRILAHGGNGRRGYLGISTQPVHLPESVRERLAPIGTAVPKTGLMLVDVQRTTAGDRAGLLLGDIIIALDDQRTADARDVLAMLGPESVGRTMRVTLVRAGAPLTLEVTVEELPAAR